LKTPASKFSDLDTIAIHLRAVWIRSTDISAPKLDRMHAKTWRRPSCWCCRMAPLRATTRYRPRPCSSVSYRRRRSANFRATRSCRRRFSAASLAVIVDAKDDNARRFYQRESFLPFPDQPMKLFRPMADIAQLFKGRTAE
jgi:hypothetical protein